MVFEKKMKRAGTAVRPPRQPSSRSLPQRIVGGYERYLQIALALPGTAASGVPSSKVHETPCVRVCGKLLSRWRTEAEGALALRCDFLDRQILMQTQPRVFFVTDHYLNYPMVLVRLDRISRTLLTEVTERAWRFVAPRKVAKQRDISTGVASTAPHNASG